MASGANAVANLNGTNNKIRTGKSGALVATNGGVVNFGGGTITHSENLPGDHDSSTPFNADSSSHINFKRSYNIKYIAWCINPRNER